MAGTLGDMKARIALELARSDLTTQIASAISDAIAICQKYRFKFSEWGPGAPLPPSFATAAGTFEYPLPDPGLLQIDYMECSNGAALFHVTRKHPELVRLKALSVAFAMPDIFAMEGERIFLAPVPNQLYGIFVHGQVLVAAPTSDGQANNRWMTDGERLIRLLAKREIARDVTRNPTMFDAMNKAFVAEGMLLITEQDRLNFYQAMHLKTQDIKGQQEIIAPR